MRDFWEITKKYIVRYKYSFFTGLAFLTVGQILINVSNLMTKFIFDSIENFDKSKLVSFIFIFGLTRIARTVFDEIGNIIHDRYIIHSAKDLKLEVFDQLHRLDFAFHASKNSGSLISGMRRGDNAYWTLNLEIFRTMLSVLVDLIFVMIAFWLVNPALTIIILIGFILNLIFTYFVIKINIKARRALNDQEDKMTGIIADNMINYETVKYFANEEKELKRLTKESKTWVDRIWGYANTFRIIGVWLGILIAVSLTLIIYISGNSVEQGNMSTGDMVVIVTFSLTFFPRLADVIFRLREITKAQTDFEKYAGVLKEPIDIEENSEAAKLKISKGEIKFDNIYFSYKDRETVISDLDLTIEPQETVALVGTSGAGKTTLIKLLFRFYDVNKGEILIDEQNIRNVTKTSLRKAIGIVPQEAMLFNNTIAFNIGYSGNHIDMKEIKHAAKLANLDEFIETLPLKYQTIVGERGIKLSGGQKQRLAIARTIIENPPIIVFDEATSQLDSKSEKLIQESFWKLSKDKTTIVIAHRLSTIMRADRIVVLENGNIVEEGTHKELIGKSGGIYRNLWNLQTGELRE